VPIEDAKSTVSTIRAEPVGAITVAADEGICSTATALSVVRRRSPSQGTFGATTVASINLEGRCAQLIAGLTAGDYDVSYTSANGLIATQRVGIVPQRISSITMTAAAVRVFGTVTLNGKPVHDLRVTFSPKGVVPFAPETTAQTDASGWYETRLPGPGAFGVVFKLGRFPLLGNDRQVQVVEGDNQRDWVMRGGLVKINLSGWDASSSGPLSLGLFRLTTTKEGGMVRTGFGISPYELPVVLEGIGFGEYRIEARQRMSPRPDKLAGGLVTLDGDHMQASIDLDLKERHTVLRVVDAFGSPITGAILADNGSTAGLDKKEIGPGTFLVDNAVPATRVTVSASGFVPVCRTLPDDPEVEIVLDTGVPIQVRFVGTGNLPYPPGRLRWDGSDCSTPLRSLEYRKLGVQADGNVAFLLTNFPRANNVLFAETSFATEWQKVRISPDGVVQLAVSSSR
jgi:hypothetical protein